MIFSSLLLMLAMTSKTIYLIRHAETVENIRMEGFYNVGRAIKRGRPASPFDVYAGFRFLEMNASGRSNSVVSVNGKGQVGSDS